MPVILSKRIYWQGLFFLSWKCPIKTLPLGSEFWCGFVNILHKIFNSLKSGADNRVKSCTHSKHALELVL